jgi:serine/threonine protein kinase
MKHKHIITYLGHEQTDKYIYIYLEFMEKGSYFNYHRKPEFDH